VANPSLLNIAVGVTVGDGVLVGVAGVTTTRVTLVAPDGCVIGDAGTAAGRVAVREKDAASGGISCILAR